MVKLVVFAHLASSGESAVIKWLAEQLTTEEQSPAYARVCCHEGGSESPPVSGELARSAVSGRVCPDHFLAAEAGNLVASRRTKACQSWRVGELERVRVGQAEGGTEVATLPVHQRPLGLWGSARLRTVLSSRRCVLSQRLR